jgi:hypothetical protein
VHGLLLTLIHALLEHLGVFLGSRHDGQVSSCGMVCLTALNVQKFQLMRKKPETRYRVVVVVFGRKGEARGNKLRGLGGIVWLRL